MWIDYIALTGRGWFLGVLPRVVLALGYVILALWAGEVIAFGDVFYFYDWNVFMRRLPQIISSCSLVVKD